MTQIFRPWIEAARGAMFYAPTGPRTQATPLPVPEGLEQPAALPDDENGYALLKRLLGEWPEEGPFPPDFLHWRDRAATESAAGERALAPVRPLLDRAESLLAVPQWQVTIGDTIDWPELKSIRRLGQAFGLRAALDRREGDRELAIVLAQRIRRAQSPLLHFLIGFLMEREARGSFEGIDDDRREVIRWELARLVIPFAPRTGPWEPPLAPDFGNSAQMRRAITWALAGHRAPYDPQATLDLHLAHREALESATSEELKRRADETIAPWPASLIVPGSFGGSVPYLELRRARPALREAENPYGQLRVAQMLQVVSGTIAAVEKATDR